MTDGKPIKYDLVTDWYLADAEIEEVRTMLVMVQSQLDKLREEFDFGDGYRSDRGFNYAVAKRVAQPLVKLFKVWLSHRAFGISAVNFYFLYRAILDIEDIERNQV